MKNEEVGYMLKAITNSFWTVLLGLMLFTMGLEGTTYYTWTGATSDLSLNTNWTPSGPPTSLSTDIALFTNNAANATPTLSSGTFSAEGISYSAPSTAYTITFSGTSATFGDYGIALLGTTPQVINNTAGTFTFSGVGGTTIGTSNLTYNISGGSLVFSNSNSTVDAPALNVSGDATVTLPTNGDVYIGTLTTTSSGAIDLQGSTLHIVQSAVTTNSGILSGTGTIAMKGTGTLTLTGANTYTGDTLVEGGTLVITGAGNLNSDYLVVTQNNATFDMSGMSAPSLAFLSGFEGWSGTTINLGANELIAAYSNYDGDYDGSVIGTGSVSLSGSRSLSLGGNSTYTGGTTISESCTLYIYDTGSLASTGPVTLNDTAVFDITGLTNGGTQIGPLSSSSAGTTVNLGLNHLTINQSTNTTYAGMIRSGGIAGGLLNFPAFETSTLIVSGDGKLTLTGNNATFFGEILVNGNLVVNGSLGNTAALIGAPQVSSELVVNGSFENIGLGKIIVSSGGTLSGVGTLGLTFINQGGTISPGNSIGTINLTSYTNNGGKYLVEVDGNGHSDLINVSGDAVINGGLVVVAPLNGVYELNHKYTIVTAASVTGKYAGAIASTFSGNQLLINPQLSYVPTDVFLTIQTAIDRAATTCNQRVVANQLDSIVDPNAEESLLLSEITSLSLADARIALDSLTGQEHTDDLFTTEIVNRQFIRRLYDPLRSIVTTQPYYHDYCDSYYNTCCEEFTFWAEGGAGQTTLNNSKNAYGFCQDGYQVTAGTQTTVCCDWTLGAAGSYEYDRLKYKNCGSGNSKTWLVGLYGLYRPSCYYALMDFAYSQSYNTVKRFVQVGELQQHVNSKPEISQFTVYGEVGVDWKVGPSFLIQPFAGLEVGSYWRDRVVEENAAGWELIVNKRDRGTVNSRLGVHMTANDLPCYISMSADLAWNKRLTNSNNAVSERFVQFGDNFNINGVGLDRNSLDYALTLSTAPCDGWRLYVEGFGEVWNRANTYSLLGGVEFTW